MRLWEDTPDYYATATIQTPGWVVTGSDTAKAVVVASGGRRSGKNAWRLDDTTGDVKIQKTLAPSGAKIIVAFGIVFERAATADGRVFFSIGDAGVWHIGMAQRLDGTIEFYRGRDLLSNSGGTSLGNSGFVPIIDTYYHFSIELTVNDSTGTLSFQVNKVEKLNGGAGFTGIDTQNGGSAAWTRFAWGNDNGLGSKPPRIRWCDLVVNDGSGGSHDTHPGDCGVYVDLPNANGGVRDFTPSTGSDDFAVVDDAAPNDATDYLESSAVNQRATLGFPALGVTGFVKSVTFRHRLSLSEAGSGQAVGVFRKGSTNYDGAVALSPTTSWDYFDDRRVLDPATGLAMTISDVDAIEGGIKRSV